MMDENDYVSVPARREIVQEVIDGTRRRHVYVPRVRENDYVEFFSAPLLHPPDTVEPYPEPNALRVIVAGTNSIGGPPGNGFFNWRVAVPCEPPGKARTEAQKAFDILNALQLLCEGTPTSYTPAFMLSKITGIPLEEVRDHLELLGDDGLVKLVPANGLQAMLSAKGRINLREGRMVATTSGVGVSTALALTHPVEITESLARFKAEHPDPAKAAFIMMRFGRTPSHEKIVQAICAAMEPHGIAALRADDKQYHDELFSNIRTYMHGCATGIAVFERIETEDFNPNVSLEVGYMLALNKPVCLLKDKSLKTLHTDLGGLIYQPFDTHAPSKGIGKALDKWLSDKGLV